MSSVSSRRHPEWGQHLMLVDQVLATTGERDRLGDSEAREHQLST
jgi:hypothetical protein